jgi:CBS domain-containing protein
VRVANSIKRSNRAHSTTERSLSSESLHGSTADPFPSETPAAAPDNSRTIAAVMTPFPVSAPADLSTEAARLLLVERGGAWLFVVDDDGRPLGTIERSDLVLEPDPEPVSQVRLRVVPRDLSSIVEDEDEDDLEPVAPRIRERSIGEVMSPLDVWLDQRMSIAQAARSLERAGARRAAVVDENGRLVGVLTTSLAKLLAGPGPGRLGGALRSATLRTIENRVTSSGDAAPGNGRGASCND